MTVMAGNLMKLTTTSFGKGQLIASKLESFGIECYFRCESDFYSTNNVHILVWEDSYEKASNLLKDFQNEISSQSTLTSDLRPQVFHIPVDFSESSKNVCYFALALAKMYHAHIKLIHVYNIPEIRPMVFDDTDYYQGTLATHLNEIREEAEKRFSEFLIELKNWMMNWGTEEVPIETSLINGIPEEVISYSGEADKASLILMGIARKDIRTFEPTGRIASKIIANSKVPVFIIPEDFKFRSLDDLKVLLYITDFDESDFPALQKLIGFVDPFDLSIHAIHICNKLKDKWEKVKMDGLKDYFLKSYNKANVVCDVIESDDLSKGIEDYINKHGISILAMTTHKRNFITKLISPSVTKKFLYHTNIPMLIFHD